MITGVDNVITTLTEGSPNTHSPSRSPVLGSVSPNTVLRAGSSNVQSVVGNDAPSSQLLDFTSTPFSVVGVPSPRVAVLTQTPVHDVPIATSPFAGLTPFRGGITY